MNSKIPRFNAALSKLSQLVALRLLGTLLVTSIAASTAHACEWTVELKDLQSAQVTKYEPGVDMTSIHVSKPSVDIKVDCVLTLISNADNPTLKANGWFQKSLNILCAYPDSQNFQVVGIALIEAKTGKTLSQTPITLVFSSLKGISALKGDNDKTGDFRFSAKCN